MIEKHGGCFSSEQARMKRAWISSLALVLFLLGPTSICSTREIPSWESPPRTGQERLVDNGWSLPKKRLITEDVRPSLKISCCFFAGAHPIKDLNTYHELILLLPSKLHDTDHPLHFLGFDAFLFRRRRRPQLQKNDTNS